MGIGLAAASFTPVAAVGFALLPGWWRVFPAAVQVGLAGFAFAVPAAKSEKAEARAEAAEEERDSARREMLIFVTDAVRPFLTEVVSQVDPAGTVPPGTASAEGVSTVLAASAKLCADGETSNSRTRACWYRLGQRGDGTRAFEPTKHFGRGNKPRTAFDLSQPRGRALLDLVRDDRCELWQDLAVEKPQNWQPGATEADYVTFMVVPVRTLASQFGVLMVDATEAGLLTEADVEAVHTLANVFALALSQDSAAPAPEPGSAS